MSFFDELILATLNEWQGTSFTAERIAEIINCSDIKKVSASLEKLAEGHYPVVKTSEGYSIPKESTARFLGGIALFSGLLSLGLFL